jgi:hypothetical protein
MRTSGTNLDGIWNAVVVIPSTAPSGFYDLSYSIPFDANGLTPGFQSLPKALRVGTVTEPTPSPTPSSTPGSVATETQISAIQKAQEYSDCQIRNTIASASATIANPNPKLEDCGPNPASVTPTPSPTPTPTPTKSALPSPTPTVTPTATASASPEPTPSPSPTPSKSSSQADSQSLDLLNLYTPKLATLERIKEQVSSWFVLYPKIFISNPALKSGLQRALNFKTSITPSRADVDSLDLLLVGDLKQQGLVTQKTQMEALIAQQINLDAKASKEAAKAKSTITCIKGKLGPARKTLDISNL